jgi:hypothetical protein
VVEVASEEDRWRAHDGIAVDMSRKW